MARGLKLFADEEAVIRVAEIAGFCRESDLLGQARAEAVGARHDDAVLDAEFHEGVAAGTDFRDEILVRDGDLTVLMAALFFVRDLIFDLERAGAGRSEEHTSELQSLMRISYAVFCLKKKKHKDNN